MNNSEQKPQSCQTDVSGRFFYEPTGQWTLTEGTIVYNFDTLFSV
jgi:hypothetical protein